MLTREPFLELGVAFRPCGLDEEPGRARRCHRRPRLLQQRNLLPDRLLDLRIRSVSAAVALPRRDGRDPRLEQRPAALRVGAQAVEQLGDLARVRAAEDGRDHQPHGEVALECRPAAAAEQVVCAPVRRMRLRRLARTPGGEAASALASRHAHEVARGLEDLLGGVQASRERRRVGLRVRVPAGA